MTQGITNPSVIPNPQFTPNPQFNPLYMGPSVQLSKSQSQNLLYLIIFLNVIIILYLMGSTFYNLIKDDEI